MGALFSLVQAQASEETVALLHEAKQAAERSEVVGVCVVLMHRGQHFTVDFAGAAVQHPALARGMVAKLDDELAKLISR